MYLILTFSECTSGGVYVPCIWWNVCALYLHPLDVPLMEFMYVVLWNVCALYLHPLDVPVIEFMYLVFTRLPGESYRR